MANYLDTVGLEYFWNQIKLYLGDYLGCDVIGAPPVKTLTERLDDISWDLELIPNNEIWYTTTDDMPIVGANFDEYDSFKASFISNSYSDGKGIIKCESDIMRVYYNNFECCGNLRSIILPNSVKSIGDDEFHAASNLVSVTLPSSIESIGDRAFFSCDSLSEVYYKGTVAQWANVSLGYTWNYETSFNVIHCSDGDVQI